MDYERGIDEILDAEIDSVSSVENVNSFVDVEGDLKREWPTTQKILQKLKTKLRTKAKFRNLLAFFLCGILTNAPYVIMITAAQYLIGEGYQGIVMLCNILPTLFVKLTAPLYMEHIPYNLRMFILAIFSLIAYLCVGLFDSSKLVAIRLVGVCFASLMSGAGDITFLSMTSFYHKANVTAYSAGTGGAGVLGSLFYSALVIGLGVSPQVTLLLCIISIPIMLVCVYFILSGNHAKGWCQRADHVYIYQVEDDESTSKIQEDPKIISSTSSMIVKDSDNPDYQAIVDGDSDSCPDGVYSIQNDNYIATQSFLPILDGEEDQKIKYISLEKKLFHIIPLLRYMIPLFFVYFAEYLIVTGLGPVLTFNKGPIKPYDDYKYYILVYSIGTLISRGSIGIVKIQQTWIMAALQVLNLIFFGFDAYFRIVPSVFITFILIFWIGLLGGSCYVNSFYAIQEKSKPEYREFSMGITSVADTIGICLSSISSVFLSRWLIRINYRRSI